MKKLLFLMFVTFSLKIVAQNAAILSVKYQPVVEFTAEQDHQNMMDQLGVKSVRPGPKSDPNVPEHANTMNLWQILIRICRNY